MCHAVSSAFLLHLTPFMGLHSFILPGLCLFGSTLVFIDSMVWQHTPATPHLPKVHMQHSTVTYYFSQPAHT